MMLWFSLTLLILTALQSTTANEINLNINSKGLLFLTDDELQQFSQHQPLSSHILNHLNTFRLHLLQSIDSHLAATLNLPPFILTNLTELRNDTSQSFDLGSHRKHDIWTSVSLSSVPNEESTPAINHQQTWSPSESVDFTFHNHSILRTTTECVSFIPTTHLTEQSHDQSTLHGNHVIVQFGNGAAIQLQSNSSITHPEAEQVNQAVEHSSPKEGFLSFVKRQLSALELPKDSNTVDRKSSQQPYRVLRSLSSVQYPYNEGHETPKSNQQIITPIFDSHGRPMGFNFGNGGGMTLPDGTTFNFGGGGGVYIGSNNNGDEEANGSEESGRQFVAELAQSINWEQLRSKDSQDDSQGHSPPTFQSDQPNCKPIHLIVSSLCLEACFDPEFVKHQLNPGTLIPSSCVQVGYSTVMARTHQQLPPILNSFDLIEYTRTQTVSNEMSSSITRLNSQSSTFIRQLKKIATVDDFLKDWKRFLGSIDEDLPFELQSNCRIQHFIVDDVCVEICVSSSVAKLNALRSGSCSKNGYSIFVSRRPDASFRLTTAASSDVALFHKDHTTKASRPQDTFLIETNEELWTTPLAQLWTEMESRNTDNMGSVLYRLLIAKKLPSTLIRPIPKLAQDLSLNLDLNQCALVHVMIDTRCLQFCVSSIDMVSIINAQLGLCPTRQTENHGDEIVVPSSPIAFIPSNDLCIQFELSGASLVSAVFSAIKNSTFGSCSQLGFSYDSGISRNASVGLWAELPIEVFVKDETSLNDALTPEIESILNSGALLREEAKQMNVIDWNILKSDVNRAIPQFNLAMQNNDVAKYADVTKRFLSILEPLSSRLNTNESSEASVTMYVKMSDACLRLTVASLQASLLEILLPTSSCPSRSGPTGCINPTSIQI